MAVFSPRFPTLFHASFRCKETEPRRIRFVDTDRPQLQEGDNR